MLLPLYLLVLSLPVAVAGQNIIATAAALIIVAQIYSRRQNLVWLSVWKRFRFPVVASSALISVLVIATVLNPNNLSLNPSEIAFGYLIWVFLPSLTSLAYPSLTVTEWRKLFGWLAVVVFIMGAIAISQVVVGWKISGTSVVGSIKRAQGFYSHPLTFAYVALLIFPLACTAITTWPRRPLSWGAFLGCTAMVYASQSRTVQLVCVGIALVNFGFLARAKVRVIFAMAGILALIAISTTDNPVRRRFAETFSAKGHDVRSGYVDDRLAFWDAHWQMVQERPLLGHGDHLNTEYRAKYYEVIGLGGFERMYEAHNMYLQVLVNAGVVGLLLFMGWFIWYLRLSWRLAMSGVAGRVAVQSFVALAVAGITQNAFQDSEVRFALALLCSAVSLIVTASEQPRHSITQDAV